MWACLRGMRSLVKQMAEKILTLEAALTARPAFARVLARLVQNFNYRLPVLRILASSARMVSHGKVGRLKLIRLPTTCMLSFFVVLTFP